MQPLSGPTTVRHDSAFFFFLYESSVFPSNPQQGRIRVRGSTNTSPTYPHTGDQPEHSPCMASNRAAGTKIAPEKGLILLPSDADL
jgi:hypothetical protein